MAPQKAAPHYSTVAAGGALRSRLWHVLHRDVVRKGRRVERVAHMQDQAAEEAHRLRSKAA